MKFNELKPFPGSVKKRRRVGRGSGSGCGRTAGRGHKGQKSRTGGGVRPGFEGGQMPLYRRLPKLKGFNNIFRREAAIVNLRELNVFEENSTVNLARLREKGLVARNARFFKVLGEGELKKVLVIEANQFSRGALKKIEAAGASARPV
jgi:large subunit ribosomal protein L15